MSLTPTPFTGQIIDPLKPGSDEWLTTISASKVPAILGLSPYDSAYSLWCRMTHRITDDRTSKAATRGTYLEPAIIQWWKDQHPEMRVKAGVSYAHHWRTKWAAAPDGVVFPGRKRTPVGILEVKTAFRADEWGGEGTAEIPPAYLAQVAWQMLVTGAQVCWVAALVNMELRSYVVRFADVEEQIEAIKTHVVRFERHLETDTAPDWDGSTATYEAVRAQHPDIDPEKGLVASDRLAYELASLKAVKAETETALKKAQSEALGLMGDAKTLTSVDGTTVAVRQARGEGKPFLKITATPHDLETHETAA